MEFLIAVLLLAGAATYLYFRTSKKSATEVVAPVETEVTKVEETEPVEDVIEAAIKKPRAPRKPKLNVAK